MTVANVRDHGKGERFLLERLAGGRASDPSAAPARRMFCDGLGLCSAKTSSFWVFACFARRHFFQSIFVVQTVQDKTPYHSVTSRNSVTLD